MDEEMGYYETLIQKDNFSYTPLLDNDYNLVGIIMDIPALVFCTNHLRISKESQEYLQL
jgi:hypothetical protein